MERFLYAWAHPRRGPKIVKIAPGEAAKYWDECRQGGYICVGWDDVGDLATYGTKEEFRAAFAELNPDGESHISRKANEVWTIRDLSPGDIVVANKGTATVMGIGRVVEPGYEYREDRPEFKHTVAVDWFDATQRQIEPIKKWAFSTVATIEPSTYRRLLGAEELAKEGMPARATSDPLHLQLEETLERKRQVVLYGPPGTGKTYLARRFAVSWLWQRAGEDGDAVLGDTVAFRDAENWLTDAGHRRAWWFVASPGQWRWQEMFDKGSVSFTRGRIDAHYEELSIGDLVVGYEASPTKRIVALAVVTDSWEGEGGSPGGPVLEPVCPVVDGPAWQEIKTDELLQACEPVKHQSQGTLFALTEDETLRLIEMIEKGDPAAASLGREVLELPTGWLTNVTFHPSYTYEDFVEGFKPTSTAGGSGLQLEMTDGIFKKVCTSAASNPSVPHVLIIDEINRGNLPKIFGELITILERDKRGVDVVLPQSGEKFSVPENVFIVGTMNTADRSIRLLDAALRRRFAFIEMLPRPELFEGASVGPLALDQFLAELNLRIRSKYGRDKQVGHSYFLESGQPITDPETFARIMRDEVMPLLQEYAYDHYGDLREILGAGVVDSESETLQLDVIADADEFVAALYEEFQGSQVAAE